LVAGCFEPHVLELNSWNEALSMMPIQRYNAPQKPL